MMQIGVSKASEVSPSGAITVAIARFVRPNPVTGSMVPARELDTGSLNWS